MIGDWQQLIASACVVAAVAVLGRRAWRLWKEPSGSGCGSGCSTCSESPATLGATTKPLVTLEIHRPQPKRPIED